MTKSICGVKCDECYMKELCKGCITTNGCPLGKQCFIAKYIQIGGIKKYLEFKEQLINEFNNLHIEDLQQIDELYPIIGSLINLEYTLPNNQAMTFLDDNKVYLGNQLEIDKERCVGIVAEMDFLLVCSYEKEGKNPELLVYKKR